MLKEKRFELNSTICCICAFVFVIGMLICFGFEYVHVSLVYKDAATMAPINDSFTGYGLFQEAPMVSYEYSVASYLNIIILIVSGLMTLATLGGLFGSQQESIKKALVAINVCLLILMILTAFCSFYLLAEMHQRYGGGFSPAIRDSIDYGVGVAPFIVLGLNVACYVVFRIFAKRGKFKV